MVKINRPVASPTVEQDITLTMGNPIVAADLDWLIPLVLGGVTPAPAEDKSKPAPIHACGVKVQGSLLAAADGSSVLSVTVFSIESNGLPIVAGEPVPMTRLGSFDVPLEAVLSNVNVPRP